MPDRQDEPASDDLSAAASGGCPDSPYGLGAGGQAGIAHGTSFGTKVLVQCEASRTGAASLVSIVGSTDMPGRSRPAAVP